MVEMFNKFKELNARKVVKMQKWSTYTYLIMKFTGLRKQDTNRITSFTAKQLCASQANLSKIMKLIFCYQPPTKTVTVITVHKTNNKTSYVGGRIIFLKRANCGLIWD